VLAVEFANGAHGTLQVSAVAPFAEWTQEQYLVLHGEAGALESRTFAGSEEISGARSGSGRPESDRFETLLIPDEYWGDVPRDDFFAIFQRHAVGGRLFVDAIREGRVPDGGMPFPTFYDGWRVQQVIDAALASHQEGRWVAVEVE
jgi:predicted dehydrogenase